MIAHCRTAIICLGLLLLVTACSTTELVVHAPAVATPPPAATIAPEPILPPTEAPTATVSPTPAPEATATASPTQPPTATAQPTATEVPRATVAPTATEVPWETKLEWAVRGLRLVGFTKAEEAELRALILEYFPKIAQAMPTREEIENEFPYFEKELLDMYFEFRDPLNIRSLGEISNNEGGGFQFGKRKDLVGLKATFVNYDGGDEGFNFRSAGLTGEAVRVADAYSINKEREAAQIYARILELNPGDYADKVKRERLILQIDCMTFGIMGLAMEKAQEQGWGVGLGTVPQQTIEQTESWAKELGMW